MCEIFTLYAHDICSICARYVLDMYQIYARYVPDIYSIYTQYGIEQDADIHTQTEYSMRRLNYIDID